MSPQTPPFPPPRGIKLGYSVFWLSFLGEGMSDCVSLSACCSESQARPRWEQSVRPLAGQETFQQPGPREAHRLQFPHGAGKGQFWEGKKGAPPVPHSRAFAPRAGVSWYSWRFRAALQVPPLPVPASQVLPTSFRYQQLHLNGVGRVNSFHAWK